MGAGVRRVMFVAGIAVTICCWLFPPLTASAASTVTNCNESGAGSLRAAIGGGGAVTFQAGLNCSGVNAIKLTSGTLTLGTDVSIDATGATIVVDGGCTFTGVACQAGTGVQVFVMNPGVTAGIIGLTIQHGNGSICAPSITCGGAIYNNQGTLTVTNTIFANNSADDGGGIENFGTLTVTNSTFSGNFGGGEGGGIDNFASTATVTGSTFSGNSTGFSGGAIFSTSNQAPPNATLTVTNSTFSGNTASGSGSTGGGIDSEFATLTVTNATFSGNSAGYGGGGIQFAQGGTTTLTNTVIANSPSGGDCFSFDGSSITVGPDSIADDGSCGSATQKTSAQINLLPLANNGGPTRTMALGAGSAALDHGDPSACAAAPVSGLDQRGFARLTTICSVGAYEPQPNTITATAGTPQSAPINTAFATNLAATVKDNQANPLPGWSVTFTAPAQTGPSGTFASNAAVTTDSSGVATATAFTANAHAGSDNVTANLTTNALGTAATFSLTNLPGPPASITANAGTPQDTAVGAPFPTALAALVKDAFQNPVGAGVSVSFTIVPASGAGGSFPGNVTIASVNTTSNGIATAPTLTANTTAGTFTVTANLSSGPLGTPATFTLTNDAATSITASGGTPQQATVGAAYGTSLAAVLKDASSKPVGAGVSVTFTIVPAGNGAGGSFPGNATSATVLTDSSGTATAPTLTANTTPGAFTVTANLTTNALATPASFTLTNLPGPATTLTVTGYPSPVVAGTSHPFTVTALDQYGNTATGYTGSVSFTSTDTLATLPATYPFVAGDAGTHSFTATFGSAGTWNLTAMDTTTKTITGTETGIVVTSVATTTTLTISPSPAAHGSPVTLTASVVPDTATTLPTPTGSVAFTESSSPSGPITLLGTVSLDSSGKAVLTTSTLTVGVHHITATYTPAAPGPYATSQTTQDVTITAAALISIAVTPANGTLKAGQVQQFTATGTYADNSTTDLTSQVTWTSDAPHVAAVDASGKGTGVSPGTAHLTASVGSISGQTGVTVSGPTPVGIAPGAAPASRPGSAGTTPSAAPNPAPGGR